MAGTVRACGCKGYRFCIECEKVFDKDFVESSTTIESSQPVYEYCLKCKKFWLLAQVFSGDCSHEGSPLEIEGVYIQEHFLTPEESEKLLTDCDSIEWATSQSGRRKQNFGPKTNFKEKKLKAGEFNGFPHIFEPLHKKLADNVDLMKDYAIIENCSLEYRPETGAYIDKHIDDCWVWGERIVTVNILGDSYLTLTKYDGGKSKYNLAEINFQGKHSIDENVALRLPMPVNSLMILYGEARYLWEHAVLRSDILGRRVCIALREFTPWYLDGTSEVANEILRRGRNYYPEKRVRSEA